MKTNKDYSKYVKNVDEMIEKGKKKKTKEKDSRYFTGPFGPETDLKNLSYEAKLRFLPGREEEDSFYIEYHTHDVNINGRYNKFICPNTFGERCPICEYVSKDYDNRKAFKRNTHYVSNVLVINDPVNPENNGKVMLFKFKKQIFKGVINAMRSVKENGEENEDQRNVIHPTEGYTFYYKIKSEMVGKDKYMPTFAGCSFAIKPSSIGDSEESINDILAKQYSLKAEFPNRDKTPDLIREEFFKLVSSNEGYGQPTSTNNEVREATVSSLLNSGVKVSNPNADLDKLFGELDE